MSFLGGPYRKVLILQAIGTALLALVTFTLLGQLVAVSALLGGASIMVGNLVYAFIARPVTVTAKPGGEVLLRHALAQLAKLIIVLFLMLAAFASGALAPGWFLVAMGVALACHWLSLLFVQA